MAKAVHADGFEVRARLKTEGGSGGQMWRWRFYSSGRITAESGEAYNNKEDCIAAITHLQNVAASSTVREKGKTTGE